MPKSVQKKWQFLNEPKNFSEQHHWTKSNNFVNILLAITYYRPTTIWHKNNPYVAISLLFIAYGGTMKLWKQCSLHLVPHFRECFTRCYCELWVHFCELHGRFHVLTVAGLNTSWGVEPLCHEPHVCSYVTICWLHFWNVCGRMGFILLHQCKLFN